MESEDMVFMESETTEDMALAIVSMESVKRTLMPTEDMASAMVSLESVKLTLMPTTMEELDMELEDMAFME